MRTCTKNCKDGILPKLSDGLTCHQNISLYGFEVKIYKTTGKILRHLLVETDLAADNHYSQTRKEGGATI